MTTSEEEDRSRFVTGGYGRHRHQWVKQALIFSSTQVQPRYKKVSVYRRKCTKGFIECLFCQRNRVDQCFYFIIGALAWNGDMLSSGSRDRLILQRDARTPSPVERRLIGHRQEVGFMVLMLQL